MQDPFGPAIAANRFGFGARPGELASIGDDPRAWLTAQLKGSAPQISAAGLRSSSDILSETLELRREQREMRKENGGGKGSKAAAGAAEDTQAAVQKLLKLPKLYRPIYIDEVSARLAHAVDTDRPFVERLTQFWTNHFAVSVDKIAVLGLAGTLEREAIRPHVLGNFFDLLLAVEQHPAMLLYLDNYLSVGPDSRAAHLLERRQTKRQVGINETLARETLELHTLGVNGGYTQKDVTTFAEVITGWSIGGNLGRLNRGEPGKFVFRPELHQPGAKTVLGKTYSQDDVSQGVAVLRDVAAKPATAKFIATKLARHFIADDPPPEAVARIETAFTRSHGDLPTVYRALVDAPESWQTPLAKAAGGEGDAARDQAGDEEVPGAEPDKRG